MNNQMLHDLSTQHTLGIGTDIVAISRIQRIWENFGQAFARRILSKKELEDFEKTPLPIPFLAKRYAAKEAVAKAVGTGFRPGGFWLTDIGVHNDSLGKPFLVFSEHMQMLLEKQGVTQSLISLSDEKEFALAFVVLVGREANQDNQDHQDN